MRVKKRIHELEQKMESAAMSLISKKNELRSGKLEVKEEIDETN